MPFMFICRAVILVMSHLAAFLNPLYDFTGFLREKIPQGAFRDKLPYLFKPAFMYFPAHRGSADNPGCSRPSWDNPAFHAGQRQFGGHNFVIYPCYLAGRFFPDITHRDIKTLSNLPEYSSI